MADQTDNTDVTRFNPIPGRLSRLQKEILIWIFRVTQAQTPEEHERILAQLHDRTVTRLLGIDIRHEADVQAYLRDHAQYANVKEGPIVRWKPSIFRFGSTDRGAVIGTYRNVPGFGDFHPTHLPRASSPTISRALARLEDRHLIKRIAYRDQWVRTKYVTLTLRGMVAASAIWLAELDRLREEREAREALIRKYPELRKLEGR